MTAVDAAAGGVGEARPVNGTFTTFNSEFPVIDYDTLPTEDGTPYVAKGVSLLFVLQQWVEAADVTDQEAVELLSWSAGVLAKEADLDLQVLESAIRSKAALFAAILQRAGSLQETAGCGDPDCDACGGGCDGDGDDPKPPQENWKK